MALAERQDDLRPRSLRPATKVIFFDKLSPPPYTPTRPGADARHREHGFVPPVTPFAQHRELVADLVRRWRLMLLSTTYQQHSNFV